MKILRYIKKEINYDGYCYQCSFKRDEYLGMDGLHFICRLDGDFINPTGKCRIEKAEQYKGKSICEVIL